MREFLNSVLPNKLFEYLASGIPVLVYNAKACAEIIEKYKIGIAIRDLTTLKEKEFLESYEILVKSVVKKRRYFALENQSKKLEQFLLQSKEFAIR
jgi:glycosyltransferase involved in cell wall biosynthesis